MGFILYMLSLFQVIQTFYKGRTNYDLPQSHKSYLYLDAFDILGIPCSFKKFESSDKSGFIRAFWRESRKVPLESIRAHDVHVLYLISAMSLDYMVLSPRLLAHVLLRFLAIAKIEKRQQSHQLSDKDISVTSPREEISARTSAFEFPQTTHFVRTFLLALFFDRVLDLPVESVSTSLCLFLSSSSTGVPFSASGDLGIVSQWYFFVFTSIEWFNSR